MPGSPLTSITLHRLEDAPNVFVSFPIAMIKHHDYTNVRHRGLLWLTVPEKLGVSQ